MRKIACNPCPLAFRPSEQVPFPSHVEKDEIFRNMKTALQITIALCLAWGSLASGADANLAAGKTASASSEFSADFSAQLAVDGKTETRWRAATGKPGEWLEIDLGEPSRFNKARIKPSGENIKAYRIQHWTDSGWRDAYRGVSISKEQTVVFSPVVASRVRLLITAVQGGEPAIDEFRLYDDAAEEASLSWGATPQNLAQGKSMAASSQWSEEFAPGKAGDGDFGTRWSAANAQPQWLEVDLGEPMTINTVAVTQFGLGITKYRIQYWAEEKWNDACMGSDLPLFAQFVFQPVRARKVRLAIDESKGTAGVHELEVFNDARATPFETFTPESRGSKPGELAIELHAGDQGRVFEGMGATSASGNTCLLKDYPEPYRSEILDFLFKPKFGAGLQHLKVEIGGGENSGCGSEPTHALTMEENSNPKPRGFEFWFMHEARKRNPGIILDCLPWSLPAWCGGAFTQNSADWFVSFLKCAKQTYGLDLDYVGAGWNERGTSRDWVVNMLRPAMNKAGFSRVKLQGPDHNGEHWKVFDQFENDKAYRDALEAVSYHVYGLPDATEKAKASGKPLWMSEYTGSGGLAELRQLIRFYVQDRITKFTMWPTLASCYEGHTCFAPVGFVEANQPWSGYYMVKEGVWYAAHVTQFADPGWKFMDAACKPFNPKDPKMASGCIALREPKSGDWSIIAATTRPMVLNVKIGTGLSNKPVHVWQSSRNGAFVHCQEVTPGNGTLTLNLEGESAYSITTTTGQRKATPVHAIPAAARFPMPYTENFDTSEAGVLPKYFMDQKGTFEVAEGGRTGKCLKQIVPAKGIMWNGAILSPYTIFGDNLWKDYEVSVDVKIAANGEAGIGGHHDDLAKMGYWLSIAASGKWSVSYHSDVLASGTLAKFDAGVWHRLKIGFAGERMTAFIDGIALADVAASSKTNAGRCFLTSSYDPNLFDNIRVESLPK